MKFAVVGAGITGLSAAWLLSRKHDVSVFESEARLGGHANAVTCETSAGPVAIDTGFIVYNTRSYPNLIAFFDSLGVETAPSDMSFAVSLDRGNYEYCGSSLSGLIGSPRNAVNPGHLALIRDIFRFFRDAEAFNGAKAALDITLGDWLAGRGYSKSFVHAHILPMAAAIWSTPSADILNFPAAAFVRFFSNHGLLQAANRPKWRTVKGSSRSYVQKAAQAIPGNIRVGDGAVRLEKDGPNVRLISRSGWAETFNGIILTCHADDALALVRSLDDRLEPRLAPFRYVENEAVLHRDARAMPRRRRLWSSWNYTGAGMDQSAGAAAQLSVTYWMNRLQPLQTATNYFVTLNPVSQIDPELAQSKHVYRHPLFDRAAMAAQKTIAEIQGLHRLWFAGSYMGYGFHEDGIQAGLAAAEDMSLRLCGEPGRVERPWSIEDAQKRIAPYPGASAEAARDPALSDPALSDPALSEPA